MTTPKLSHCSFRVQQEFDLNAGVDELSEKSASDAAATVSRYFVEHDQSIVWFLYFCSKK